jgi:hypothetical protein
MNVKEIATMKLITLFVAASLMAGYATPATAIETPASGSFTKSLPESSLGSLVEETDHYYPT